MRLLTSSAATLLFFELLLKTSNAFVVPALQKKYGGGLSLTQLAESTVESPPAAGSAVTKKPASPQEILAKAGMASEAPKIFEDDLLDDMQQMLLKVERRVKEGPGCISLLEAEEFEIIGRRVLTDLKRRKEEGNNGSSAPTASTAPAATSPNTVPSPAIVDAGTATATAVNGGETITNNVMDISNDEAPAYDGTGGLGMAKGTRSTYVIPGMDEMSPEEYRKALQQSVIDRQAGRQKVRRGGNRATWDYMNSLTGESGVLKDDAVDNN